MARKKTKKSAPKKRATTSLKNMKPKQKLALMALLQGAAGIRELSQRIGGPLSNTVLTAFKEANLVSLSGAGKSARWTLTTRGLKVANKVAAEKTEWKGAEFVPPPPAPEQDEAIVTDLLYVVETADLTQEQRTIIMRAARRLGKLPHSQFAPVSGVLAA